MFWIWEVFNAVISSQSISITPFYLRLPSPSSPWEPQHGFNQPSLK